MKKKYQEKVQPITFEAQILAYPVRTNRPITLFEIMKSLEDGEYDIELIMPIERKPTLY